MKTYNPPTSGYLIDLITDLRTADQRAREASAKWNARDEDIRRDATARAARTGEVASVLIRIAKRDDTDLGDHWSSYSFWAGECARIAAVATTELAVQNALAPRPTCHRPEVSDA